MKTKSMQEGRETLHDEQDSHSQGAPNSKTNEQHESVTETSVKDHLPQHFRKLSYSEEKKKSDSRKDDEGLLSINKAQEEYLDIHTIM